MEFSVTATDGRARRGRLALAHGIVETPIFMPVGTYGSVKAMSPAYFRILERHPSCKKVFQISNHLVWVTPSGSALVVDTGAGQEEMSDADIDRLFVAQKTEKK